MKSGSPECRVQHAGDASYYYLSNEGETRYFPAGQGSSSDSSISTVSLDHTRLPRPPSSPERSDRRSSIVHSTSADKGSPALNQVPENAPRLGLPKDWIIYPLSRDHHRREKPHGAHSLRKALSSHSDNLIHHDQQSSGDSTASDYRVDFRDINPKRIDYNKPLSFELCTESAIAAPFHPFHHPPSADPYDSLGPCSSTPYVLPKPDLGKTFHIPHPDFTTEAKDEEHSAFADHYPNIISDDNDESRAPYPSLPSHPRLLHSRPLPQQFTEEQLREIRRQTRHCIRVVTRTSIGLTSTLALSGVAPQLLIAAAINAYCLGRGAHRLHQHLQFLQENELRVRKQDIILAVAEGVAVKVAFMAITINHDDFIVLTHELLGPQASPIIEALQAHPVPGFRTLNELFLHPIERAEESLDLPTMAERASLVGGHAEHIGTIFGEAGWDNDDVALLMKNILVVGGLQGAMEHAVDFVQDSFGKALLVVKERIEGGWRKAVHKWDHVRTEEEAVSGKKVAHQVEVIRGSTSPQKAKTGRSDYMDSKKRTLVEAKSDSENRQSASESSD